MSFKQIINKYNTKWDIPYIKYIKFKNALREDLTVDELYTLLSELYDVDKASFDDINPEQLDLITSKLHDIVQTESPLVNRFKLNGIEYGIIPDFSKIKAGELIDLDNLFANDDIVGLMSILYRPIKKSQWNPFNILGQKRYEIEPYKEPNHKAFELVPISITDGALSFFFEQLANLKLMFDEIYNPSPLAFQTSSPPISSPIANALSSYGNYMELVNLYCSNQPHLYNECFKVDAIEFLSYSQYQLLRKKHEQEYVNKSQQKN